MVTLIRKSSYRPVREQVVPLLVCIHASKVLQVFSVNSLCLVSLLTRKTKVNWWEVHLAAAPVVASVVLPYFTANG